MKEVLNKEKNEILLNFYQSRGDKEKNIIQIRIRDKVNLFEFSRIYKLGKN